MEEETEAFLRKAMDDLLNGRAGATNGKLTWNNVVKLAPISRATSYRGTESLRREFEERCIEKRIFSAPTIAPPEPAAEPRVAKGRTKDSSKALRQTIGIMADHIQALSLHIEDLTRKLAKANAAIAASEERVQPSPLRASNRSA